MDSSHLKSSTTIQYSAITDDALPTYEVEGKWLVACEAITTVVSRAWEFALPLALLGVWGGDELSLRAPAALALAVTLATTLFSPRIGKWADGQDRLFAARVSRAFQVAGTACSVGAVLSMASEDTAGFRNWLALALGGASVEALGGVVTRGGPKKDWAPALFEGEALGGALSKTTVALSNAAQVGEILGPFLGATAISSLGPVVGAGLVGGLAAAGELPAQLILDGLYRRNAALRKPPPPDDAAAEDGGGAWARCWRQPGGTALLTGSFGCLFFTALAPHGPVLTAFLATRGVDPRAIAVFRTLGAFAGIGGIYAFGKAADGVAKRAGDAPGARAAARVVALRSASFGALGFQCCAAVGAAAALAAAYGPGAVPGLAAFMAAVALSRAGLYAYDVGYLELQQLLVDERDRGACQGVEAALCGGNELLLALVTLCFFHDPRDFGALAALSALFVGLALALFAAWAALYHVHDHDHGRGDHPHEHTPQQAKALDESGAKRHVHVHRADHGAHDHGHGHHDRGHDHA